jgi:hypothetical protein
MTTKKFVSLLIWFLCLIVALEFGFEALSAKDTLANIVGLVLLASFGFLSAKTDCFTNIKIKRK